MSARTGPRSGQVRALGGRRVWPASSSKQIHARSPPATLFPTTTRPYARWPRLARHARPRGARGSAARTTAARPASSATRRVRLIGLHRPWVTLGIVPSGRRTGTVGHRQCVARVARVICGHGSAHCWRFPLLRATCPRSFHIFGRACVPAFRSSFRFTPPMPYRGRQTSCGWAGWLPIL